MSATLAPMAVASLTVAALAPAAHMSKLTTIGPPVFENTERVLKEDDDDESTIVCAGTCNCSHTAPTTFVVSMMTEASGHLGFCKSIWGAAVQPACSDILENGG